MRSHLPALALLIGVTASAAACTGTPSPAPGSGEPAPLDPAPGPDTPPTAAQDAVPAVDALVEPEAPDITPTEPRYAATHVLIAWKGAARAADSVTRSRADALTLARDLHRQATAGAELAELARAHSDGPTAPRGGDLGVYATGTMLPDFEKAVASVPVGAIAPLVHTPFGYHVIRRDPVIEGHFQHIQIAFQGAWRSTSTRSRAEARELAEQLRAQIVGGADLSELAKTRSDDPSAALNGGDLGLVAPGQLVPAFEDAAFDLQPGETSTVVETPYGFHVIRRLP